MVKGCVNPPYIHRACLNSCDNYNIQKNCYFNLFRHSKLIQKQGGVKVAKSKGNINVHYDNACKKGKSPGFLVVLQTFPGARYRLETTACLEKGDKVLIGIESLKPSCSLLSKTPSLNGGKKSFEITFQAISDFTVLGYFFHCNTKEYCLNLSKFNVVSCDPKGGCNPGYGKINKPHYRCETCHHHRCRCHSSNSCRKCLKKLNSDCHDSNSKCLKKYSCTICYKCTECYKCTKCNSCAVCCICYSPCVKHQVYNDNSCSSSSSECSHHNNKPHYISTSTCIDECGTTSCSTDDTTSCTEYENEEYYTPSEKLLKTCPECPKVDSGCDYYALCRKCAVQCDYILENPCPHVCGLTVCQCCIRCSTCLVCSECCSCIKPVICHLCLLPKTDCNCNCINLFQC